MPLIPLLVQNEVNTDASSRVSAFNFCDPFDHVLPTPGTTSYIARQHLWGMYGGIAASPAGGFQSAWVIGSNTLIGGD